MIKIGYDKLSCGCRISLLIRDGEFGILPPFSDFELEEKVSPSREMFAKQSLHNLNTLSRIIDAIKSKREQERVG